MAKPTAHEALIYLMVVTSASDRDMTDVELARIGEVVQHLADLRGLPSGPADPGGAGLPAAAA